MHVLPFVVAVLATSVGVASLFTAVVIVRAIILALMLECIVFAVLYP